MSGSAVDASIALNANRPQMPNPLVQMQQYAQTAGGLANLQNTQMQLAGRNALMQAYQGAPIDPKTGLPDQNALIAGLQNAPGGGLVLPEVIQQIQARQLAGYQLNHAQIAQQQERAGAFGSFLGPLVAKGANVTPQDIYGVINRAHAAGIPTDEAIAQVATSMPMADPSRMSDPAYMADYQKKLQAWAPGFVKNAWGASLPPAVQAQTFTPNVVGTNTGGGIKFQDQNAVTNPGIVGSSLPTTLTPEAQNARIPAFRDGAKGSVPLAAVAVPGTLPGGAATGPLGTGRYPTAAPGTAPAGEAPAGTALPPPAAAAGGFIQTDPALGQEAAASHQGAAYGTMAANLISAAATVPDQKALLGNMDTYLNDFTSGPGAEFWRGVKARANAWSPTPVFDTKPIANQEEFAKMGMQLAQQQFHTLGGTGTDAKLNSTMHTSPSEALSNLGNHGIIALLKGNADAIAAMNRDWQTKWLPTHNNDPNTYGQFVTQFNQQFDPRVFQSQYVQDPKAITKGMSPVEKKAFYQDYNAAVANGWIPDPRVPTGGVNAGQ